jgi:cytochrome c-type biogenesis protein CcmI
MFWFTLAGMTGVAVAIAVLPMVLRRKRRVGSHSDIAFYCAQIAEIDEDVQRGQLPPDEASAARAETARRLLAANAAAERASPSAETRSTRGFAILVVALIVSGVGTGTYLHFGRPGLRDAPLASRADATRQVVARDDGTREDVTAEPDPVQAALVRIEAEAAASPDSEQAWSALAPVYIRLGRYADAVTANRNLLRIKGEDGTLRANLGEAEVAAAGGKVTPAARADFELALADSPGSVMARFYLGLATEQAGDAKKALEAYEPLIEEAKDHPHWVSIIQARIKALQGPNALDAAQPAAPAANAGAGVPDRQKDMVNAMVSRLATRLAQSGGSVDDWMRLIRSYAVLNDPDKVKDALASARKAFGTDAGAGAKLDALEQELNQSQIKPPEAAQPSAPAANAGSAVPDSQKAMVNAMVSRLATRLAQSGGSVDDWMRLIRSYAVLNDSDKVKETLTSARAALGADAGAGAKLDALEQELKQNQTPAATESSAPAAGSNAVVSDSQKDMVNAMVSRLATRLAKNGGGVDDWMRLIRSYAVLKDNDKAREALATARKELNADAAAGPKLDTLASELNLAQP